MEDKILDNRYKIVSFLGNGGFGKTYLAEDTKRPRNPKCVVKQLSPKIDNPEFLETARRLFKTEAETLEVLGAHHDQIPRLLAYFSQKNEFYLVQEYIEGQTLSQELSPSKPWSEVKVIDLLRDCLKIIDFVHSNDVIHRDIKPGNLIRRRQDNKIILIDFGSVKEVVISQTQTVASTIAVGTIGYMPPEQAYGKPRFTSDIYALGVVAIQALTGIRPTQFEEDENDEIVWQPQAQCSPELKAILTKMTRYHFQERYQSASEILKQLKSFDNDYAEIPVIQPVNPIQPASTVTIKPKRKTSEDNNPNPLNEQKTYILQGTPTVKENRTTASQAEESIYKVPSKMGTFIQSSTHKIAGIAVFIGLAIAGIYFTTQYITKTDSAPNNKDLTSPVIDVCKNTPELCPK